MAEEKRSYTLGEIAVLVGGVASGSDDLVIARPVPADSDDPAGITFAENEKYLSAALSGGVGAVLVPAETPNTKKAVIRVAQPRMAFGAVLAAFVVPMPGEGIHSTAQISAEAFVDPTATIGPYVSVESGARVGAGSHVMANAYIGQGCVVGDRCQIYPNVVLVQDVRMGLGCRIHAGSVIGADGFGYFWDGQKQQKVPQVGGVLIGNYVEIGANTCIDRATCGDTVISDGVKIDNLVQVAHNVKIGVHTVMAAQVGLSGSTVIGERNVFGGQAATSDHVTVGDNMVFGGRTGITGDMDVPGQYFGTPAVPLSTAMRVIALQTRLPELFKRMRAMERELEQLRDGKDV
ncbi:MAG: UDP-3-O-(3-hydroxymyristoyl)glucosamine N-acyltransferase [Fimbriimonadaceae bacterium]